MGYIAHVLDKDIWEYVDCYKKGYQWVRKDNNLIIDKRKIFWIEKQ